MKKKKKIESIKRFMNRRNKESGKVTIPETKVSPENSGGSHKTKARQMMHGVTKPKTIKRLERNEKKKKRQSLEENFS
jgi:hypothetical protein